MLLGYHYMQFYHWAYGINQWLADQGYVVLSVNYRSGIGYGRSFRTAPNTGGRGNAEYQDVLAGGKYLQSRPDVDPDRVGIWGLSYGGVLTAQALARNSDIFKAGVDLAGVHLWGSSLDPESVSFKSSVVGAIDRLEVAGAARPRRRRPQRGLPADDRPRAAAARSATSTTSSSSFRTTRTSRCCTAAGCTRSIAWSGSSRSSWAGRRRRRRRREGEVTGLVRLRHHIDRDISARRPSGA